MWLSARPSAIAGAIRSGAMPMAVLPSGDFHLIETRKKIWEQASQFPH
jgi:hypothetical protein